LTGIDGLLLIMLAETRASNVEMLASTVIFVEAPVETGKLRIKAPSTKTLCFEVFARTRTSRVKILQ
ncbi:7235_t:CDS:1, partial [Racocetra fulgida]